MTVQEAKEAKEANRYSQRRIQTADIITPLTRLPGDGSLGMIAGDPPETLFLLFWEGSPGIFSEDPLSKGLLIS